MAAAILEQESDLPARRVDHTAARTLWMLDRDAAGALREMPDSAGCHR